MHGLSGLEEVDPAHLQGAHFIPLLYVGFSRMDDDQLKIPLDARAVSASRTVGDLAEAEITGYQAAVYMQNISAVIMLKWR